MVLWYRVTTVTRNLHNRATQPEGGITIKPRSLCLTTSDDVMLDVFVPKFPWIVDMMNPIFIIQE